METYIEMKNRHQAEINALPLAFAFSKEQYRDKLAAWNITEDEAAAGAVIGISGGGFIRATDKELVSSTFKRIQEEKRAAIEADTTGTGYIYQGLKYELINHEYSYTEDATEAIQAVGLTLEDMDTNAFRIAYKKATEEIRGADPYGDE